MSDLTITHAGIAVTPKRAGSSISTGKRRVIRVTATTGGDTVATNDVFFTNVEVPNAVKEEGGISCLKKMYIVNNGAIDGNIIFTEKSCTLGTLNDAVDISEANLKTAGVLGVGFFDATSDTDSRLVNTKIIQGFSNSTQDSSNEVSVTDIFLKAASGSTSVYCHFVAASNSTSAATDGLQLIFHLEH